MLQTRTYNKYTPDEMDRTTFLRRFVVRVELYEKIFDDIENADYEIPQQHYILVGQRGQGKTTLLRRIEMGALESEKLQKFLIPIKFAEEQYQIRTLGRLWEEIADILQNERGEIFPMLFDDMDEHYDHDDYDELCYEMLSKAVRDSGKKLLLLIDNIDELLNKLTEKEQRRLREILITSSMFRIIGGSSHMLEQHFQYDKPFYEFFRIEKLTSFNSEETQALLRALADEDEEKQRIEEIITKAPQRIELLRRLTGGVPRTIVMLFEIFMDDDGTAFNDLRKILDEVTPLYKHRMDDLPTQLQDIMHTIAMNWDGIPTKEIAKKTRLESKKVSAQLNQLEKAEIIESEAIGKKKIYKIAERFFNIWYLMRFGRKRDRTRVEWLIRFLESWCTPEELNQRAYKLIESIKTGNTHEYHAFHMTEALCYAGLDAGIEHELKTIARNYLEDCESGLSTELTPSTLDKQNKVVSLLMQAAKSNEALEDILKVDDDFYLLNVFKGIHFHENGEVALAGEYFRKALESEENALTLLPYADFLYRQEKDEESHELYLKAIYCKDFANMNKRDSGFALQAYSRIGAYFIRNHEYESARKYLELSLRDSNDSVIDELYYAVSLANTNDTEKAIQLFHNIDSQEDAINFTRYDMLGRLYLNKDEYDAAEKYLLKALELGSCSAIVWLGALYQLTDKPQKARKYYLQAIKENCEEAKGRYSWFLFEQNQERENALLYVTQERESTSKSYSNTHTLAVVQLWNDQFSESNETFEEWLTYENALENEEDFTEYIILLLAKGQLYRTKNLFEIEEYQLKDRYKPLWYALAHLMGDEMKVEIAKMGSELEESVQEIIAKVKEYEKKYN